MGQGAERNIQENNQMEKQRTRKRRERAEHSHKATKLARNSEELGDKALLPQ